jgi:hypothetical protein
VTVDPQRHRALLGVKLGALVRDHAGEAPAALEAFGGGAALLRDGEAWVLADERPIRMLGPALAWARQRGVSGVHVLTDDAEAAGVLARRAAYFTHPPSVWLVDGRTLQPGLAQPLPPPEPLDPAFDPLVGLIEAAGVMPVVEHGVLSGEVAGLEVCRAVLDPDTGHARLDVGVGAHDREAFRLIHGDLPPADALAAVAGAVAEHRRPGAEPHPLNRLGAERLLRHRLLRDPSLADAVALEAAAPPVARENLNEPVPCVATGVSEQGRAMVVVCSVGVDLDLVPFAADARAATGPSDADLVLAVPARDAVPVTYALASALRQPALVDALPSG